jgi:hypothetical protein
MGKKRPERTHLRKQRRDAERTARAHVRTRELLARAEAGGMPDHPIDVASSAVIEVRARATPCPQCDGALRLVEHVAESASLRRLELRCAQCGTPRRMWFRIVAAN